MSPSMALFHQHRDGADVTTGVALGKWDILDAGPEYPSWPIVLIAVVAPVKQGAQDRYWFRFDLSGYPTQAPTACLWDREKNERLAFDKWPKGGPLVASVFRTGWNGGNSPYAPCDRMAIPGHPDWAQQYPEYYWQPRFTIYKYLRFLHDIFYSGDYMYS